MKEVTCRNKGKRNRGRSKLYCETISQPSSADVYFSNSELFLYIHTSSKVVKQVSSDLRFIINQVLLINLTTIRLHKGSFKDPLTSTRKIVIYNYNFSTFVEVFAFALNRSLKISYLCIFL